MVWLFGGLASDIMDSDGMAPSGMPSGEMASGGMASGEMAHVVLASGCLSPGDLTSGVMAPTDVASGDMASGGMVSGGMALVVMALIGEPSGDRASVSTLHDGKTPTVPAPDGKAQSDPISDVSNKYKKKKGKRRRCLLNQFLFRMMTKIM